MDSAVLSPSSNPAKPKKTLDMPNPKVWKSVRGNGSITINYNHCHHHHHRRRRRRHRRRRRRPHHHHHQHHHIFMFIIIIISIIFFLRSNWPNKTTWKGYPRPAWSQLRSPSAGQFFRSARVELAGSMLFSRIVDLWKHFIARSMQPHLASELLLLDMAAIDNSQPPFFAISSENLDAVEP